MVIRIDEGLDIPITGAPAGTVGDGPTVASVALLGDDYVGLSPAMRVKEGDQVKLGQTLFVDRKRPDIRFTSPGSGTVVEINRGARRALLSVVVRLGGDEEETFASWPETGLSALRRDQVLEALFASGMWPALRARPFNKVADPGAAPRSIFVTATDSNPLAPPPETIINAHPDDFANGLTVVSRLTDGPVFVCQKPNVELSKSPANNVSVEMFSGPHPAGLVGTHIHHLDPIGAGKSVWHIGYQDVIAVGHLFTTGQLMTERTVALAGPMVREPCLIRTRLGANTENLTRDALMDGESRVISGSVLSGHWAKEATAYLGRYHNQVSVIAEGGDEEAFSIYRGFGSKPWGTKRFSLTSTAHGKTTAMIPFGGYERVLPLDILATPLLRALLVGDVEMAEALGCLELDEEDLALCTFVCPSKLDHGPLLRAMLNRLEKEG